MGEETMVKILIWLSDSLSHRVGVLTLLGVGVPSLFRFSRAMEMHVFPLAINSLPDSSFSTGCGRASRIGI